MNGLKSILRRIAEISQSVENLDVAPIVTSYMESNNIRTPIKGVDYFDGYTPIKNVDYFDGYTPIKGVDYFDGATGEKGGPGIDGKNGITQSQAMARQL